jgi:hypothetical protein
MKEDTARKRLLLIYGFGESKALKLHKKLGLNLRISPTFIGKKHNKYFDNLNYRKNLGSSLKHFLSRNSVFKKRLYTRVYIPRKYS